LREWSKSGTLTLNASRDTEQQECSFIAGRKAKWYSQFGRVVGHLTKLNTFLTYRPAFEIFGIYTKELKTCLHKNLCMDVYVSFIHNCKNLNATKMFFIM
jgi:hypothetical protein